MAICKIPISCLPTSAGLDGSELIPVVEGELTKQTQLNNLSGFVDLQYITDAGNCTTNDLSTSGSITSHTLSSDHMTNTGSITTESLTATEIHALSTFTTYVDVREYELSGFNVTGNVSISGNMDARGLTIDNDTLHIDHQIDRVGINTDSPNKALTVVGDISASDNITTNSLSATNIQASDNITTSSLSAQSLSANTIIGGVNNIATGNGTSVLAGRDNIANGNFNVIAGGSDNTANGLSYSNVAGGFKNTASNMHSNVAGGCCNVASGMKSTVTGGFSSQAAGTSSVVGGGQCNESINFATFIGAGSNNIASGGSSTIVGGNVNKATGLRSFIGNGFFNEANGSHSVLVGGLQNNAGGNQSTVAGGQMNIASGSHSTVAGGCSNTASGSASFIAGGSCNTASASGSFILGSNISASAPDTTYINNLKATDSISADGNTFVVNANTNRVGIGTNNPNKALTVAGDISASGRLAISVANNRCEDVLFQTTGDHDLNIAFKAGYTDPNKFQFKVRDASDRFDITSAGGSSKVCYDPIISLSGTGQVGIHNPTPKEALDIIGNIFVEGGAIGEGNVTATGNISTCKALFGQGLAISVPGSVNPDVKFETITDHDLNVSFKAGSTSPNEFQIKVRDETDRFDISSDSLNPIMSLCGTGQVGIGTTNPNKALTVVGDISATGGDVKIGDSFYNNPIVTVLSSCRVGINKVNPDATLQVVNKAVLDGGYGEALRVVGNTLITAKADAALVLQADSDNTGGDDEPLIKLKRGLTSALSATEGHLGVTGNGNEFTGALTEATFIQSHQSGSSPRNGSCENIQLAVNDKAGLTVRGSDTNIVRVGIGTNEPNQTLTVIGDISATGRLTVPTLETNIEASELVVTSGLSADGNTFTVDATSNRVGIGTNTPNSTLDVFGNLNVTTGLNVEVGNSTVQSLTAAGLCVVGDTGVGNSKTLYVDVSENKVGIGGTITPNEALTVVGNISGKGSVAVGVNNIASGQNSSVVGGSSNIAEGMHSFIGGSALSKACGTRSAVVGGVSGMAFQLYSAVVGGQCSQASGIGSTVTGSNSSIASNSFAAAVGGQCNRASGIDSTVTGGNENVASGCTAAVVGGEKNAASETYAAVVGGLLNTANASSTVVVGGTCNTASFLGATITGGFSSKATSKNSHIGGGCYNITSGENSHIGAGLCNEAVGNSSHIGGGCCNYTLGDNTAVLGGTCNIADGNNSTIVGGNSSRANCNCSFIAGGECNIANANNTFILGSNINATVSDIAYVNNLSASSGLSATNIKASDNITTNTLSATNIAASGSTTVDGDVTITDKIIHSGDPDTALRFPSDNIFTIETDGSERLRVTNTGIVTDSQLLIDTDTFVVNPSTDRVGINAATPNEALTVVGNISACGQLIGGRNSIATGFLTHIGGGLDNSTIGSYSTIGGGLSGTTLSSYSVVGGGAYNTAGETYSTVGGGTRNQATGLASGIFGGMNNTVTQDCSFIIGSNITADTACTTFVNNLKSSDNITTVTLSATNIKASNTLTVNGNLSATGDLQFTSTTGDREIRIFNSSSGDGGDLELVAGSSTAGDTNGGDINLIAGGGNDNGLNGHIILEGGSGASEPAGDVELKSGSSELKVTYSDTQVNKRLVASQGVQLGTFTTTERNAITSPQDGLIIYNTTDNAFQGYKNGNWATLG